MPINVKLPQLTLRENEVLFWLSTGKANNMIGDQLGISGSTVKAHVGSILRKLKIASRLEVAIVATKHNGALNH